MWAAVRRVGVAARLKKGCEKKEITGTDCVNIINFEVRESINSTPHPHPTGTRGSAGAAQRIPQIKNSYISSYSHDVFLYFMCQKMPERCPEKKKTNKIEKLLVKEHGK